MKELTKEKTITTRELAEQLGTDKKVIIENARKYLPNKVFEQGKPTFWNKAEVTVLIDGMKGNNSNQYKKKGSVTGAVTDASTDLTPALKLKKAMELMREGYEEELAILRAKNAKQEQKLTEQKPKVEAYDRIADSSGLHTMQETAGILDFGSNTLFAMLREKGIFYITNKVNLPKREYINAGYFTVKEKSYRKSGSGWLTTRIFVTAKGLLWLEKITKGQGVQNYD